MKDKTYSKDGEELSVEGMRRRNIGEKKCDEDQIEEKKCKKIRLLMRKKTKKKKKVNMRSIQKRSVEEVFI